MSDSLTITARGLFLAGLVFVLTVAEYAPAGAPAGSLVPTRDWISDDQARRTLAQLYLWTKDFRQAYEEYQRLTIKHPQDLSLTMGLLQAQIGLGRHREARNTASGLEKMPGADPLTLRALAGLQAALGHARQSRHLSLRAAELSPETEESILDQAGNMNLWGDFYRLEGIYRRHLDRCPDDWAVALLLARVLMSGQRYEEAEAQYRHSLTIGAPAEKVQEGLCEVRWEEKDLAGCQECAQELASRWPNNPAGWSFAAQVYMRQGHCDRAAVAWARLASLPGHQAPGYVGLGWAAVARGFMDAARLHFEQALTFAPRDPEAIWGTQGLQQVTSDNFVETLTRPGALEAPELRTWGELYAREGYPAPAIRCFRAALREDPEYFPASLSLAENLAGEHQYAQALEILDQLVRDFPGASKVAITRARVLAWSKKYDSAVARYMDIHRLNPQDPVPLKEAARAAAWGKNMDQAQQIYTRLWEPTVDQRLPAFDKPPQVSPEASPIYGRYESLTNQSPGTGGRQGSELLSRLRPTYRVQKAAWMEARAKQLTWDTRLWRALETYQNLLDFQPGNQEAWFDRAQVECSLGLCDRERWTYQRLLELDPRHNLAGLALKRNEIRSHPQIGLEYTRWEEQGRGETSGMVRHQTNLNLDFPFLGRFHLQLSGRKWLEQPMKWGADARAQGFSLDFHGEFNEFISGGLTWTHKVYQETGLCSLDSGGAQLWLNLRDYARLGVGWLREDVVQNAFSLRQGVQVQQSWLGLNANITRQLEVNAKARSLDYSDGNTGDWETLSLGYSWTDHPRIFKTIFTVEHRNVQKQVREIYQGVQLVDMIHPYWTPQNWWGQAITLEWNHDLAKFFFCGAEKHYYDLRLSFGTDTDHNSSVNFEAEWLYEFADRWTAKVKGQVYRSKQWDSNALGLSLDYRF